MGHPHNPRQLPLPLCTVLCVTAAPTPLRWARPGGQQAQSGGIEPLSPRNSDITFTDLPAHSPAGPL